MGSFSKSLNKPVNSNLPSPKEKCLEENISVQNKTLCKKDKIIKKLVDTQSTALNTILSKSNNQHLNILNQLFFTM